jgi:MFS family permease
MASTLSNADRHVLSVLLPSIKREFGLSDGVIGLIAGPVFIVPYVLFTMPLARLADRWSRRSVLAGAIAFWSVATGICGLAANAWVLMLGRLTVGMGEAGGSPPSQSLVASLFSKRRSLAMGVLASGTYFGVLAGVAGGAAVADQWGWRAAFLVLAAPGIPLALLIWLTGPRRRKQIDVQTPAQGSVLSVLHRCFRIRSLVLLSLGMGIYVIYGYAAAIWLPSYFILSHGMSMTEAGMWLGIGAAAGGITGSLASGAIVEALLPKDQRWQLWVPALGILLSVPLLVTVLLLPSGVALTLGGHDIPMVAVISVISAFLGSLWMGPSYAALARLLPLELRGQAVALLVIVINVMGSMLGPPIAGLVSDLLAAPFGDESLRYSLLSMSVLAFIGGLIVWRAASHYRAEMIHE